LLLAVIRAAAHPSSFSHLYELSWPITRKIETIAVRMYGASRVSFEPQAERHIDLARQLGYESKKSACSRVPDFSRPSVRAFS
jgi:formate--tetrahydrofolate ligase